MVLPVEAVKLHDFIGIKIYDATNLRIKVRDKDN